MNPENITAPSPEQLARASGVSREAAKQWSEYWRKSRARLRIVSEAIEAYARKAASESKILDWGCALGGVAMLIEHELHPREMHAADVDPHSIAWLKENDPNIRVSQLEFGKPLPYEADQFDIVIGISVFTHLKPSEHNYYLRELRRITQKGGLLLFTVASYTACDFNVLHQRNPALHPRSRAELEREGSIFTRYPAKTLRSMEFSEKGVEYGMCYHSHDTIRSFFGSYFDILAIQEGALGPQDLLVLRKAC